MNIHSNANSLVHQTSKDKEHSQLGLKNLEELFALCTFTPKNPYTFIPAIQGTPLVTPAPDEILNSIETSMNFEQKQRL